MTPDIQAPFSLLLLFQVLTVLTASVPTSPSSTVQVSSTQSSPTSSPTKETSLSVQVSLFFLSFRIINLQFNSSLENPQTSYYQELKRSILDVILQTYKQRDFLGLSEIKFRPGSVVVDLTLAFREGTTAELVKAQFSQLKAHAANYSLTISGVSGCVSVRTKEMAAGHLSNPRCLPSYERVLCLPHPWALCAPW
uniref:Mucin-1 n=1 Tax=Capra hircus TaxID=9925 RepID=A0A8C2SCB5_CAPHI